MAVPPAVVTVMGPLTAPAGTIAVTFVSLATLKNAALPPKLTAVVLVRPLPVRVTLLPTGPEVGAKLVSVGVGAGVGVGVEGSSVVVALSVVTTLSVTTGPAAVASCGAEEPLVSSLTVMSAARAVVALAVEAPRCCSRLDELLVPPSPTVMESRALLSVKSACTVLAIVPVRPWR